MRKSSTRSTPLPPSVEKAYHKKCIELKRRLNEIEEANDAARLRKKRIDRSIMKMRLERAFLLDRLAKAQNLDAYDSDKSTTPPPTPQERPTRQRRTHRSPQPEDYMRAYQQTPPNAAIPSHPPGPPMYAIQAPYPSGPHSGPQISPTHSQPPHASSRPRNSATVDRRGVSEIGPHEQLPLINTLPNGTNVLILPDGNPKQPPWTIRDIEPRHHLMAGFDQHPFELQAKILQHGYCPYDVHGNPVIVGWDDRDKNWKHVFKGDPEWQDPVVNKVRIDDPLRDKEPAAAIHIGDGPEQTLSRHQSIRGSAEGLRRESGSVPGSSGSASGAGGGGGGGGGGGFTAVNR